MRSFSRSIFLFYINWFSFCSCYYCSFWVSSLKRFFLGIILPFFDFSNIWNNTPYHFLQQNIITQAFNICQIRLVVIKVTSMRVSVAPFLLLEGNFSKTQSCFVVYVTFKKSIRSMTPENTIITKRTIPVHNRSTLLLSKPP